MAGGLSGAGSPRRARFDERRVRHRAHQIAHDGPNIEGRRGLAGGCAPARLPRTARWASATRPASHSAANFSVSASKRQQPTGASRPQSGGAATSDALSCWLSRHFPHHGVPRLDGATHSLLGAAHRCTRGCLGQTMRTDRCNRGCMCHTRRTDAKAAAVCRRTRGRKARPLWLAAAGNN